MELLISTSLQRTLVWRRCLSTKLLFGFKPTKFQLDTQAKKVVEGVYETIGLVNQESNAPDSDGGGFWQVRVSIDISKPLCKGQVVSLGDGKEQWVAFKYERLTNICFWWRCLSHDDKDCDLWINSEGSLTTEDQQFGPWVHASPFISSRKNVVVVPSFYSKKNEASLSKKSTGASSIPLVQTST